MSRYPNFKGPLFDPTGLGLASHDPQGRAWRQRHLAGISHNETENVLIAFNADGLAMPLEFDRYALPRLLSRAVKHEFGVARGNGRYGLTDPRYRFMLGPDGLKNWITYWFAEPDTGYANDKKVFDRGAEREILELTECRKFENLSRCPVMGREFLQYSSAQEKQAAFDKSTAEIKRDINEHAAAEYQKQIERERDLAAWLKGERLKPKPLAAMQAAA